MLTDEDYRTIWSRWRQDLGDGGSAARTAYLNRLYRLLRQRTKLSDPEWTDSDNVPLWPPLTQLEDPGSVLRGSAEGLSSRELLGTSDAQIHPANRDFIHSQMNAQAWESESLAVRFQVAVIERIYEWLIRHPRELDPGVQELVSELVAPTTDPKRGREIALIIHSSTVLDLRDRLSAQGYELMQRSWKELGSIH